MIYLMNKLKQCFTMRLCYIIVLLLSFSNFSIANIWEGDYFIQSETEANNFKTHCNCSSINGDLIIRGDDIIHLDSLHLLTTINGYLKIIGNDLSLIHI